MRVNKKDLLKALKADKKAAEVLRNELDDKIDKWKAEHNGEPYGNERKGRSQIISRDIKKQSEWQHASIIEPFVANPDIVKCSPITFEDKAAAEQNELVLNTQFCRQFDRYNFMSKATKVLDQEGTVVVMTGWEYEDEEIEVEIPIIELDPYTGQQIITGTTTSTETKIIKNQPTAKVCRNEDVFIDPTCQDDMDNCQFVIYRYETDMSTLRADGRYKNLGKLAKQEFGDDTDIDYDPEDETEFKFKDKPRQKLVVYEYWGNYDVNDDGVAEAIVCTWVGDTIIRLQDNPYPDGKVPFLVVPFNSIPFQLHGESNAELLSDVQKIKTAIFRGFIDNMAQSTNGQKGIRIGSLDPGNRKKYLQGENFEFNGSAADFFEGSYNQIPGSAFNVLSLLNAEAESITGTKSFSQGITGNSLGGTATGARGALDATATRRLNIVRNISENLVKPLMRKWMSYNSEFLDEEFIVRITNDEFVPVKRDDLGGFIDIEISVSTSEDNAARAQELAFILQTIGPSEDPSLRKLLMAELTRLQKMPDVAKKIEEYQPQPDPMQQEMAMLQMELLKAQIANERAKGQENVIDSQLKMAKTQNELAKAGKTSSEKDMLDLDFTKDINGVKRQEEIQDKEFDRVATLDQEAMKQLGKGS